jgi:hypothetical protein
MKHTKQIQGREKERDSLIHGANRELTICEQLRRVYDSVYELPDGKLKEQITEKLLDAFITAKKIADRLLYYYETYHDKTGSEGDNLRKQLSDRSVLIKRRARK